MESSEKLADALSEFASTMLTEMPVQGILNLLVERLVESASVTAAGATILARGKDPQYVAASSDFGMTFEHLQTELGQGPCLSAYQSGQAVAVPDLPAETMFPRFCSRAVEDGLAAVFAFPLRGSRGRMGAIDLYQNTAGMLDAPTMKAVQTMADVAAAYVLNAKAWEQLRESLDQSVENSLHDPLTGLANRTLFFELLEQALLRNWRTRRLTAVLYCDLDQFKHVNDTYGHDFGDQLLMVMAERLKSVLRPSDGLARIYGDEFVILCEDLSERSEGESIAARAVHALGEPYVMPNRVIHATVSIGVAFSTGTPAPDELLNQADMAMYGAKRKGGGRYQTIDTDKRSPFVRRGADQPKRAEEH